MTMNLKLALPAIVFLLGVLAGWHSNGWRLQAGISAAKTERLLETRQIEQSQSIAAARSDARTTAELDAIEAGVRVVTQEVIRYVQSPDAGHCRLPADWVHIHNRAAGVPAAADSTGRAAGPPDTSAGADDRAALAVVTANYAVCRTEMARLQGWQDWYHSLSMTP